MSFQAMTWACEQDLPCNQKMVLMMLANRTNHDTGRCDPSHKRLAKDCGMSTATLKRCIKKLEEDGFLEVICRKNGDVNLPNQYQLNLPGVGSQRTQGGVTENPGWGHSDPRGGVTVSYKPVINNQEVNQEDNQPPNPSSPDGDLLGGEREADAMGELEEAFAIFWAAGMVKTGKKAARSRFLKLAKEQMDPLAFARSLADDIRERLAAGQLGFDKMHPTTYLNGERWEDDIVPGRDTARAARPMHDLSSLDHANDPMMAEDGRLAPEPRRNR